MELDKAFNILNTISRLVATFFKINRHYESR